jgi:hypothetical protein
MQSIAVGNAHGGEAHQRIDPEGVEPPQSAMFYFWESMEAFVNSEN